MGDDKSFPLRSAQAVHPPVAFFGRTYEDALALTQAARDYIAGARRVAKDLAPGDALAFSVESMRLTTRVVQVMAWCLARKAIFAGELDGGAATIERFALSGRDVCLGGAEKADNPSLPERFRALLSESRALYVRVLRLDELLRRAADG
jgi:regulator of CtrA degradation